MPPRIIARIVFLVLMTISAMIAIAMGFIIRGKNKNVKDAQLARKIMKFRLICFVFMLICLFICVVI